MTILITGASGYVGRYTVAAARARRHKVLAHVRRGNAALPEWRDDPDITVVMADLDNTDGALAALLPGVDAIIHAAASLAGDDEQQQSDTLRANAALCDAVATAAKAPRLVLVSSMSVYSGLDVAKGAMIDETAPLEKQPEMRDTYCRTKLEQEQQAGAAAEAAGFDLWIMRVGSVYGPTRLWNAHVGIALGALYLRLAARGQIPLIYVEHCAEMLIRAAETPVREGANGKIEILNLVDDDLPDRIRFLNAVTMGGWPKVILPLSWRVFAFLGSVLRLVPGLAGRLPGLFRTQVLHARMKPLAYSNKRMHQRLDWNGRRDFETAMAASLRGKAGDRDG